MICCTCKSNIACCIGIRQSKTNEILYHEFLCYTCGLMLSNYIFENGEFKVIDLNDKELGILNLLNNDEKAIEKYVDELSSKRGIRL